MDESGRLQMVARVSTVAFRGIDTLEIDVQVHIANTMPGVNIVGLPAKAVDESKDRVRSALASLGLAFPPQRITVNLAPADVIKEGSHYDLPIALGILAAMGVLCRGIATNPVRPSYRWCLESGGNWIAA
jgi:magnesium chelatase family protein